MESRAVRHKKRTMEFSHSVSLFFDAPTMSGMKEGHLCGQSCGNSTHAAIKYYSIIFLKVRACSRE